MPSVEGGEGVDPSIEELIEKSSLGTPSAKALRDSVTQKNVDDIMARVRELEEKERNQPKFSHAEAMDIAARVDARHAGQEEYPQSEKLRRAYAERHIISDFLEWLGEEGFLIRETREDLLMRYLDIDTVALETERRKMLNEQRKANEQ